MGLGRGITWQRGFYLLIGISIFRFVSVYLPGSNSIDFQSHVCPDPQAASSNRDVQFDIHNEIPQALTAQQCDALFPDLYHQIDRSKNYWNSREHRITAQDVDVSYRTEPPFVWPKIGGALRILIHENELRVVESRVVFGTDGYRSRGISILGLLHDAIKSATAAGEKLPTIEASIILEDIVEYPSADSTDSLWTFTANTLDPTNDRHWLVPNFDFFAVPMMGSFRQARRRAAEYDSSWTSKIPKLVWRGTLWYNMPIRVGLTEATKNKPWADILGVDYNNKETMIPVDQMCGYAMTVHTEGGSYSGRLKYLLLCDSLTFVHDLNWRTVHTHLLERDGPNQNYVSAKRDWSDLSEKVEYYLDHPDEAERIVANALATFRNKYLAPAAQACYVRKLIHGYSSVSHKPEVFRPLQPGQKSPDRRGKSYEEWLQDGQDYFENQEDKSLVVGDWKLEQQDERRDEQQDDDRRDEEQDNDREFEQNDDE